MGRSAQTQQKLFETMERQFGQGVLKTAATLTTGTHIPTGFAAVDSLLQGGGITAGQIAALVGQPTSGATTLAYHLLGQAQHGDRLAAWIDPAGTFDAEYALSHCGVVLDRLLLIRDVNPGRALDIALDLVRAESATLIVLDWSRMRVDFRHLERLHANLAKKRCALLLRLANTPKLESIYTLMKLERLDWLSSDNTQFGYRVRVGILRDTGTERNHATDIDIALMRETA